MTTSSLEIEMKFSVGSTADVPSLCGVTPALSAVLGEQHHSLRALYFDTPDLRLTRAKVTLRRRTGGGDAGWHIKLPATTGRQEIHAPLEDHNQHNNQPAVPSPGTAGSATEVPTELLQHVRHLVGSQRLIPIAQVDNERTEITYGDSSGAPTVFLCDDHVCARSLLSENNTRQWREWELELAAGVEKRHADTDAIMQECAARLRAAGATPADSPSKLVTALGSDHPSAHR
ncbi:CYTH domain-containing protein [Corynebacterium lizhenjunii]|uniref:CYTH domain-containing protein n=1 Tax=Corynebacterium lizhenjunii TaxID=2709394 RepID=A0A7T0PA29_9CORY|nr:CYTH domain-containing protein [Corynebacterium lizhenjunii]QPK78556.1 CYTH domain-containing protein [Corynebacterium lizhenjunii]